MNQARPLKDPGRILYEFVVMMMTMPTLPGLSYSPWISLSHLMKSSMVHSAVTRAARQERERRSRTVLMVLEVVEVVVEEVVEVVVEVVVEEVVWEEGQKLTD